MELMEINGLEIRSTIPPSGYLVQGSEEQLNELKNIQSVESIHNVPAGLMVHSSLYDAPADQSLVVEITGWKNSDLVRQLDVLGDNLQDVADLWLTEFWSPDSGIFWGEIQTCLLYTSPSPRD